MWSTEIPTRLWAASEIRNVTSSSGYWFNLRCDRNLSTLEGSFQFKDAYDKRRWHDSTIHSLMWSIPRDRHMGSFLLKNTSLEKWKTNKKGFDSIISPQIPLLRKEFHLRWQSIIKSHTPWPQTQLPTQLCFVPVQWCLSGLQREDWEYLRLRENKPSHPTFSSGKFG